jgi:hypothetical protein
VHADHRAEILVALVLRAIGIIDGVVDRSVDWLEGASFVMLAAVIRPTFSRIAAWYQREFFPLYPRT